jgi:hypothetical protein
MRGDLFVSQPRLRVVPLWRSPERLARNFGHQTINIGLFQPRMFGATLDFLIDLGFLAVCTCGGSKALGRCYLGRI